MPLGDVNQRGSAQTRLQTVRRINESEASTMGGANNNLKHYEERIVRAKESICSFRSSPLD